MNIARLATTLVFQAKASPYKAVLLGVLSVLFVVLVGRQLWGSPRPAEATQPLNPAVTNVASVPEATPVLASLARPPLPDLPDALARDLFQADWLKHGQVSRLDTAAREDEDYKSPSDAAPVLLLELTLTEGADGGQHYAVINGRRVQVGDAVGKLVVESITPGLVILAGSGTGLTALRMD